MGRHEGGPISDRTGMRLGLTTSEREPSGHWFATQLNMP